MSNNECRMEKERTHPSLFDIRHSSFNPLPTPHTFFDNTYAAGWGITSCIPYPASCIPYLTSCIQDPASCIQHPASSIQHLVSCIPYPTSIHSYAA